MMREILRMQIGQILGRKMKWLVAVVLLLPVLLTAALAAADIKGEIERALDGQFVVHDMMRGEMSPTARETTWQGEDLDFYFGDIRLRQDGLHYDGHTVLEGWTVVAQNGYVIVHDARLFIDEERKASANSTHIEHFIDDQVEVLPEEPDLPTIGELCFLYLGVLYPQVICLLVALFYGTSVLGHELGGKTLTYLFTRPLPRWKFVVGKYLGIIVSLVVPTAASLTLSSAILGFEGGIVFFLALLVGAIGSLVAATALFVLFGFLLPRRAMVVAVLYIVVFEVVLTWFPVMVNQITVTHYVRSLMLRMVNIEMPAELQRFLGDAPAPTAIGALIAFVAGSLALASILAARREFVVRDQA